MPTSYTHYKFGQQVREAVPENIRSIIDQHPDLYYIGLHGPDLLFYNRPYLSQGVFKVGSNAHRESGKAFFEKAGKVLLKDRKNGEFDSAELAYMYGFLCHYALDSRCHGYIDEIHNQGQINHYAIEAEWDRTLLLGDGYDPLTKYLTDHIHPSEEGAAVIQKFFPSLTGRQVLKAFEDMIFWLDHLVLDTPVKKAEMTVVLALLKVLIYPAYDFVNGLIIHEEVNPYAAPVVAHLQELYKETLAECPAMLTEFTDHILGNIPWQDRYCLDFEGIYHEDAEEK